MNRPPARLQPVVPAPPTRLADDRSPADTTAALYPELVASPTRRLPSYLILLLLVLSLAGCLGLFVGDESIPLEEPQTEVAEEQLDLAGRTLVLNGYNGSVLIEGTPDDKATLALEKVAYAADGGEAEALMRTITVNHSITQDAYTVDMYAREAGRTGVNVTARVPFGTSVKVVMENGAIVLLKVEGKVHVENKNGSVQVEGAKDDVFVNASNANVIVKMATCPEMVDLALKTKTGNITLHVPDNASAWVDAEARIGSIRLSDMLSFKRAEHNDVGDTGTHFTGALGSGSGAMNLRIHAGAIFIREAD